MSEDYQRLMHEISELKRQMAGMFQTGTVHEVKGDKLRVVIGKDRDGKDVLSPGSTLRTIAAARPKRASTRRARRSR